MTLLIALHRHRALARRIAALTACTIFGGGAVASAQSLGSPVPVFVPGDLLVSRNVYSFNPIFGAYPFVWNNVFVDPAFGITSRIILDQVRPNGALVGSLEVPNSSQPGITPTSEQMVGSFSSKSELALNLSTDGAYVTFMGYLAPVDALDVSNSNTPGVVDPTNPDAQAFYRVVARVDSHGLFHFTTTNAFSGDNGRAAIIGTANGTRFIYTAGNAGNGGNPQPDGILVAGGAQIMTPQVRETDAENLALPTPVGSFNITELGAAHDKIGKDNNFRGVTIFDDVVYFTKGSGSNGVNTVYFIDTTGEACPHGVGLPQPGTTLPASGLDYDAGALQTLGLTPNNMCILKGFPATLNSALKKKTTAYPFALWFANATTLYVADEGDGAIADVGATPAGLQKWVFDAVASKWTLVYTLQTGLGLGATYAFPGSDAYPTGNNPATGLPWAPITAGLRNITGRVSNTGVATIWGITATVSGNGDTGADPNKLVAINDIVANTNPAVAVLESFVTLRTAAYGEVLRGVSFTPGTMPPRP